MVRIRRPSVEDDLWWKKSFVEDDLRWKTTFSRIWPAVEDDLWWKTNFGGRHPSQEDNLQRKTTFGGRWLLVEDDLWWKMTFIGRRPSVDPCMLPTPLCGMFSSKYATIVNLIYMPIDKKGFCITGYLINILFYFISNYKGRLLGASRTDSNCNVM